MINIVTIDPSIISTGLTINGKIFSIVAEHVALTTSRKYKKWFERCEDVCDIITIDTSFKGETVYSTLETNKLESFQKTSNLIRKLVDIHCDSQYNTLVLIEGYSYSSAAGPLIDLVTFGTTVRKGLFMRADTELIVLAPSTVKKLAARLTYPPIIKGKKVKKLEYRNNEGVAGGSFKKAEIYKTLTENDKIKTEWVEFLREQEDEALSAKSVPKPIEDINDSVVMYHIAHQVYLENDQDYKKAISFIRDF